MESSILSNIFRGIICISKAKFTVYTTFNYVQHHKASIIILLKIKLDFIRALRILFYVTISVKRIK